jgi:DNA polymerase I-like protein with 3'-5' exonuclease and polymerase domains
MNAPIQTPPLGALLFASADYDGLELRTMAQASLLLVGESRLAQVLNAGDDPHLMMGANMLGLTYEAIVAQHKAEKKARGAYFKELIERGLGKAEASALTAKDVPAPADDARQAGKVANFGFPGGLGAEKLVLFARKSYKVSLTLEGAKQLKRTWLQTFPEFRKYFEAVNQMMAAEGATFRHFYSGRVRGNANYCATCNSFFQGLGADATGNALFLISEACYTPTPCLACQGSANGCGWCRPAVAPGVSPLYGTRLVNYIHDDNQLETPERRGHEVAHELVRVMVAGAAPYIPDVPATAKPQLSRFWSKDAEQVWIEDESSLVRDAKTGKGKRLVAWPKAA